MTPQERLALALQYQKQRDLGSVLPSTPAENAARPVREPEQSWLDKLSEVANGVGYGLGQQVEGLGQMARHPLDTLHSIAVGAGKAMDNPSAAAQAAWEGLKQSAGEAVSSPFNLGQAVGANVNINPRKIAAMLESPAVREIVAYHGTPHRFEPTEANPLGEFDASKIGTGEGAQAYGHGVYLAEAPEVAEGYKKTISQSMTAGAQRRLLNAGGDLDKAIADTEARAAKYRQGGAKSYAEAAEEDLRGLRQFKEAGEWTSGSLYHADLPDEMIDRMLDWDKPLSEQPKAVKAHAMRYMNVQENGLPPDMRVMQSANGKFMVVQEKPPLPGAVFGSPRSIVKGPRADNAENAIKAYWDDLKGADFYKTLAGDIGDSAAASSHLSSIGIPGIKYLDAGSRGAEGTGTRNFVVFPGEEKKVKILERK